MTNIRSLHHPTIPSFPVGANSPGEAAILLNNANTQRLMNINRMSAGSKRRKYRGGTQTVVSPTIPSIYKSQNTFGTDTTSQQADLAKISMQSAVWSANDKFATKMGGSYKKRNSNRLRKMYTKKRKSIKMRRSRRHR